MRVMRRLVIAWTISCAFLPIARAQPAFPGAEGFGAGASGGRGGDVIKVTTLAATGPGSLQAALDAPGPRIIVFEVSGVIEGDVSISHGDVTIAGQTAPGAGITIGGRLFLYADYDQGADNVIVRHVRIRPPAFSGGAGEQYDGMQGGQNTTRIILDHVSICCGVDETADLYTTEDITLQWSTIEESQTEGHPEGMHNYGLIVGPEGRRSSIHHVLFAGHRARAPAIANGPADITNVVAYNVRHAFVHHNPAEGEFNMIGNYFRDGPTDDLIPLFFDDEEPGGTRYYVADTYVDDPGDIEGVVENPWNYPANPTYFENLCYGFECPESEYRATSPFDFSSSPGYVTVTAQSSTDAYASVLARAGAFPRDAVTRRVVMEVEMRTGEWGARLPADLLEGLAPGTPPADADDDGMADDWETANGLDPSDGNDHTTLRPSGYTAIEDYVNGLADALLGPCEPSCGGRECGGDGCGGSCGTCGGGEICAPAGMCVPGAGDGGVVPGRDSGTGPRGDGGTSSTTDDGCGCSAAGGDAPILVMALVLWFARRRPTSFRA
jgi:hypothetical protein